eukprot:5708191-Amphidinium_carterae.1
MRSFFCICSQSGVVTGFGLEFLAEKVSTTRDAASVLQLCGLVVASVLLPGLAGACKSNIRHSSRMSKHGRAGGTKVVKKTSNRAVVFDAKSVLPGLVTSLCHANCLGAWTYFWAPCRVSHSFGAAFGAMQKSTSFEESDDDDDYFGIAIRIRQMGAINVDLVSRTDMCSL